MVFLLCRFVLALKMPHGSAFNLLPDAVWHTPKVLVARISGLVTSLVLSRRRVGFAERRAHHARGFRAARDGLRSHRERRI